MIAEQLLEDIFRTLFSLPDLDLRPDTTFVEIPGWDSLSRINVIFGVEQAFGFRFTDHELEQLRDLTTLGALRAVIDQKRTAAGGY